jgi:hypothetical protein
MNLTKKLSSALTTKTTMQAYIDRATKQFNAEQAIEQRNLVELDSILSCEPGLDSIRLRLAAGMDVELTATHQLMGLLMYQQVLSRVCGQSHQLMGCCGTPPEYRN